MGSFSNIMRQAWTYVKHNGFTLSVAMKLAWSNFKLIAEMRKRIVKFYFTKVDGTIREAYGTLADNLVPETSGTDTRKKNETVQVYFDTEKQSWRSFKKANLLRIA